MDQREYYVVLSLIWAIALAFVTVVVFIVINAQAERSHDLKVEKIKACAETAVPALCVVNVR